MLSRIFQLLLVACLAIGTSRAANDPFVGKWKVNASKSKLNDEMKVEAVGENKYTFTFGPGEVDTVVADGSDQPALSGTTLSVTVKGPNTWEVIRKMKGRTLLTAHWTLSEDGKTLNDAFTQYLPDGTILFSQPLPNGSTLFMPLVYERTAGISGFPGTWDSESAKVATRIELQIQAYEGDGLSFKRSDEEMVKRIKFDGNDHPDLDAKGDKVVKGSGTTRFIRVVDIDWIEGAGVYVNLHVAGKELPYRSALNELAGHLDPLRFIRVHRSAIVNIDSILQLQPISHGEFEIVLKDGHRSRVSRTYRTQLEKRLGQSL